MPAPDPGLIEESDAADEGRALRVLFDGLPAMIGYWDSDLHNVIANEAYVDWFGISPDRMKGMHISEIVSETVYRANIPYMTAALRGEQQTFQRTLVDVSGATRHAQVSYSPDAPDGEVVGLFVMITDVTAQVEAQRELAEAQELASSTGMATGQGYDLRYRMVGPDAQIREMHSRVRAEHDAAGTVSRLTGTIQDVTSSSLLSREMARVNEELRQVNQLNADVLGVVGHDVRTPLALVLGHLEELTATWGETGEDAKLARVDRAFAAAHRLSSLIDDILAMASFDSGTIATRPIRVELREVVTDALAGLHAGSAVEVRLEGTPVSFIDPFHLRQMIANLVSNALRYGAPPVVVTIDEDEGSVWVEVTDLGAGVPEEFVPHLFERFTRASTGVAAQQSGSGFGLYIVARLAEANGCRLTYSPGSPSGSRFRLELPASS